MLNESVHNIQVETSEFHSSGEPLEQLSTFCVPYLLFLQACLGETLASATAVGNLCFFSIPWKKRLFEKLPTVGEKWFTTSSHCPHRDDSSCTRTHGAAAARQCHSLAWAKFGFACWFSFICRVEVEYTEDIRAHI